MGGRQTEVEWNAKGASIEAYCRYWGVRQVRSRARVFSHMACTSTVFAHLGELIRNYLYIFRCGNMERTREPVDLRMPGVGIKRLHMPLWCQKDGQNHPWMDGMLVQYSRKTCRFSTSITPDSRWPVGTQKASHGLQSPFFSPHHSVTSVLLPRI